jgi:hypothetical protein
MAKKKTINLSDQNITFTEKERHFKVISLNLNSMEVEVTITEEGEKKKVTKMPLGHLPKEIKKLVRPV